jgi:Zn-dependent protease with chaperone function
MTIPETLFVFGHEMGHYVLGHILQKIALLAAILLLCLYVSFKSLHRVLARFGDGLGIRAVEDWASFPLILLLFSLIGFLLPPITNTHSRHLEHEADVYGIEVITGIVPDVRAAATDAFQILGEVNLSDPDPPVFIRLWLYDHDPVADRIRYVQEHAKPQS